MTLSVKQRIGIAMSLVVLVNLVAGGFSWALHDRANQYQELARQATDRAAWVAAVSEKVGALASEATDLALSVANGASEESSSEYGDLVGADAATSRLVGHAPSDLDADVAAAIAGQWEALRPRVFSWVNTEAERAGSTLRLTFADTGEVRASASSNITLPAELDGLDSSSIRRAVRNEVESFSEGQLRLLLGDAEQDARAAERAASRAREIAIAVTIAAIAASLVIAVLAAVWIYGTIAGPLVAAERVARQVAAGDYSVAFTRVREDEIGALVHAVEEMRDTVVGQVSVMRELAGAVMITASNVSDSTAAVRHITPNASVRLSEILEDIEEQSTLLSSLAEQMLNA